MCESRLWISRDQTDGPASLLWLMLPTRMSHVMLSVEAYTFEKFLHCGWVATLWWTTDRTCVSVGLFMVMKTVSVSCPPVSVAILNPVSRLTSAVISWVELKACMCAGLWPGTFCKPSVWLVKASDAANLILVVVIDYGCEDRRKVGQIRGDVGAIK